MTRTVRCSLTLALGACALLAGGCQSSPGKIVYTVDVRNQTPQPLWAQLWHETDRGAFQLTNQRLAPGDRAGVGPAKGNVGRTWILFDTLPNPSTPVRFDLEFGSTVIEVTQTSEATDAELIVREIR